MPLRVLSALLLLLALPGLGLAQSPTAPIAPQPTLPDSIPTSFGKWYLAHYEPSPTVADTAGALVSLFSRKRSGSVWYVLGLPLGVALVSPTKQADGSSTPPDSWQIPIGIPLIGLSTGGYVARLATYSRDRLAQIQRDYVAGKPIPATLRRKLKPVHFANAAVIRVAVVQQLQMAKLREQQRAVRKK